MIKLYKQSGVLIASLGLVLVAADLIGYDMPRVGIGAYAVLWGVMLFSTGVAYDRAETLQAALSMRDVLVPALPRDNYVETHAFKGGEKFTMSVELPNGDFRRVVFVADRDVNIRITS